MDRSVTEQLRAVRRKKGLTQVQLAEATRISQPTISQMERGTGNPTLSVLEAVASALGVRLTLEEAVGDDIDTSGLSDEDRDLVRRFLQALPKMSERERYGMWAELDSYDRF